MSTRRDASIAIQTMGTASTGSSSGLRDDEVVYVQEAASLDEQSHTKGRTRPPRTLWELWVMRGAAAKKGAIYIADTEHAAFLLSGREFVGWTHQT